MVKKEKIWCSEITFNSLIKKLSIKHPNKISGPYGLGGMLVFTPFEGNPNLVSDLLLKLYNNGLMGFTTGSYPQRIRFLLPLGSVTKKDIEEAINIIDKSISETP